MLELLHDPDPARAHRAMEAMTRMIKIDIAEVECAADAGRKTFPAPRAAVPTKPAKPTEPGFRRCCWFI